MNGNGTEASMTGRDVLDVAISSSRMKRSRAARGQGISNRIREHFADGKWHPLKDIAAKVEAPEADVITALRLLNKPHYFRSERKQVGASWHYRIFKQTKMVSVEELTTKLAPILEGLKVEGRKNMATMVPAVVAKLAAQLERILQELAE